MYTIVQELPISTELWKTDRLTKQKIKRHITTAVRSLSKYGKGGRHSERPVLSLASFCLLLFLAFFYWEDIPLLKYFCLRKSFKQPLTAVLALTVTVWAHRKKKHFGKEFFSTTNPFIVWGMGNGELLHGIHTDNEAPFCQIISQCRRTKVFICRNFIHHCLSTSLHYHGSSELQQAETDNEKSKQAESMRLCDNPTKTL